MRGITVEQFVYKQLRNDSYIQIYDAHRHLIYDGDVYGLDEDKNYYDIIESHVKSISLASRGQINIYTDCVVEDLNLWY